MNQDNMQNSEHVEILDAYRMMANDKGWYNRIINHINSGLTAEAAVEQAYTEMWNRLSGATDTYLKERLHDLRDIAETKFNEGDFVLVHGNIQSSRRRPEIKNQSTIAIFGESLEPAQSSIEQETGIKAKDARIPFINKFVVAGEVKGVDSPTSDMVRLRIATNKNGHLSFVRLVHFTHNPADIINEIKAGDRVCVVGCTQTNKKLVDDETRYFEDYVALEIAKDRN
jgi:hypothetical protein